MNTASVLDVVLRHAPHHAMLVESAPNRAWLEAQKRCVDPIVFEVFFRRNEELARRNGTDDATKQRALRQGGELASLVRKVARSLDGSRDLSVGTKRFVLLADGDERRIRELLQAKRDTFFLADCRLQDSCSVPLRAKHVFVEHARTITNVASSRRGNVDILESLWLPRGTRIENDAFLRRENLSSLWLPVVTHVGDHAFFECPRLRSIWLPAATTVGMYAFSTCSNLTTVSLDVVTKLEEETFSYCPSLREISLPAVTHVGKSAFGHCRSLTEISLPEATRIGEYAFDTCSQMTSVFVPLVAIIDMHAFSGCSRLEEISLPVVKEISDYAFINCLRLNWVSLPPELSNIGNDPFLECTQLDRECLPPKFHRQDPKMTSRGRRHAKRSNRQQAPWNKTWGAL